MTIRALLSDQHCHSWSQFASTGANGINTRLQIVLDELERAADALLAAGGTDMMLAGDLFHVRGSIDPEVFNPTHERIKKILLKGVRFFAIPGNHDLKGKETTEIGNAIQTLGALEGFNVITEPKFVHEIDAFMIPWCSSTDELRRIVADVLSSYSDLEDMDLIIHAGMNGVLANMPDHGLDPAEVVGWGFRRVFAGHFHNHKELVPGKAWSIGATSHQNWGDVGTRAGFLLIDDDSVKWHASRAPSFVDLDETTDPDEIPLIVDDNYVRIRGLKMSNEDIKQMDRELRHMGARGISFQVARETVSARAPGTTTKLTTLEEALAKYIERTISDPDKSAATIAACSDIMSAVTAVA